jgi:hypothetical protein
VNPRINCRGDVVWSGSRNDGEGVYLWQKKTGATIQIRNEGTEHTPLIGCAGELVWQSYDGDSQTLKLGAPEN